MCTGSVCRRFSGICLKVEWAKRSGVVLTMAQLTRMPEQHVASTTGILCMLAHWTTSKKGCDDSVNAKAGTLLADMTDCFASHDKGYSIRASDAEGTVLDLHVDPECKVTGKVPSSCPSNSRRTALGAFARLLRGDNTPAHMSEWVFTAASLKKPVASIITGTVAAVFGSIQRQVDLSSMDTSSDNWAATDSSILNIDCLSGPACKHRKIPFQYKVWQSASWTPLF